jgi:hypothetical protein
MSTTVSLQQLAMQTIYTIHSAINQIQLPIKKRLEMILDNTKFLLAITTCLLDEQTQKELKKDLEKAEKVLHEFEKVNIDDNIKITTHAEMQANLERKIKEREKYIIDICLGTVSKVVDATKGQVLWQ